MRAFFEGPAGSGKTQRLIERTVSISTTALTDPRHSLLALTFMNGARLRLNGRFSSVPELRGRFQCTTFDSFAQMIAHRQRSLLRTMPILSAAGMSQFDITCREAARLLELPAVQNWVAAAHPLIAVDEAQDLNEYRFAMLRALAGCAHVVAAADYFQNLSQGADTTELMAWLRSCDEPTVLTQIHRTSQNGLLRVAAALRAREDVRQGLAEQTKFQHAYSGPGIRIVEVPAANVSFMAWTVANELAGRSSRTVILTPDASSPRLRQVIDTVQKKEFPRNRQAGTKFGPFAMTWERGDEDEAREVCRAVPGTGALSIDEAVSAVMSLCFPERRTVCDRIDAARLLRGETTVSRQRLNEIIEDVVRNRRRFAPGDPTGRRVMTIQRAKNREFADVVVLWPQSVPKDEEQQRRLLYNAITRAKRSCSVVVFGKGRLSMPPFRGGAQT
jgi:hypothetical protein